MSDSISRHVLLLVCVVLFARIVFVVEGWISSRPFTPDQEQVSDNSD